jgi:HK97 family phage major capsid protein
MTDKTPEDLAIEVKAEFDKKFTEVTDIAKDALDRAEKGEPLTQAAKEQADAAIMATTELKARLDTLEQAVAEGGNDETEGFKSLGEMFTESDSAKGLLEAGSSFRGKASFEAKATLTSLTTDAAGSVGDAIQNTRLAGILPMPQRRMTVRDLLSQGRMDGNTLEYVKETGFTNSAGMVAEGAAKPASDIKLDLVSTSAKVIAHYMKASRQVMDDIPQLQSVINNRLLYGLAFKEESQLLNGDNTGQNLNGIVTQATAYVAPFDPAGTETGIDMIRLAMLQAFLAEYPASGIVMHPSDWARIELLKDSAGGYLIGNPQGNISQTLWGLPVVDTQAMTVDKFLVGAFKLGAQVFDRWTARVEIATENEDDFIKNLVTILAEERLALAVYRPEAFIYGDFGNV